MEKLRLQMLLLFVAVCFLSQIISAQEATSSQDEKREAEKAWEALIKTKGGREKLHLITNMLTEFSLTTRLDVFPNRVWEFKGPFFGNLSLSIFDRTKSVKIYASQDGENDMLSNYANDDVARDLIIFLLETKWDKTELLRVRQTKILRKKYDVIETIIRKQRIDFIYEQEEMLVSEVDFYDETGVLWKKLTLSDYTEINGIKMPQTFGLKQSFKNLEKERYNYSKIKFSFNVEYDPQIFERPLKATTSDAWKVKP